jgi:hypothetical protein
MVGTKRKETPSSRNVTGAVSKKQKTVPPKPKKSKPPPPDLEAETDSDPIVESDTPEHSGEDDGVSWPSDDDDEGGVELADSNGDQPTAKKATDSTSTCE